MGDEAADNKVSQLAGGYNLLARDFDRALVAAKFEWSHHLLIQQAREASWVTSQIDGSREPRPFRLNLSEIAREVEVDRSSLSDQHAVLVACRVFLEVGDGSYLINKDYRTWTRKDGTPRLTPGRIDWSKQARRKARPVASRPQSGQWPPGHSPTQSESPPRGLEATATVASKPQSRPVHATVPYDRSVASRPQSGPSPRTPIEESPGPAIAGAGANLKAPEKEERELSRAACEAAEAKLPSEDAYPILPGPHSPTSGQVLETHRLATTLLGPGQIPGEIFGYQRVVSPEVWQAAIREAHKSQPTGVRTFRYVLSIASRYDAEGIPAAPIPSQSRPSEPASRPTPAQLYAAKIERQKAAFARRKPQPEESTDAQG